MPYQDEQKNDAAKRAYVLRNPEKVRQQKRESAVRRRSEARRAYERKYYKRNAEKLKAKSKRLTIKNAQALLAYAAVRRSQKIGLPADLELLRSLTCPTHCPALGTPISFEWGKGYRPVENTASFDRIVGARGYVEGNVQILSRLANQMKSCATPEQLRHFAKWILKTYGEK